MIIIERFLGNKWTIFMLFAFISLFLIVKSDHKYGWTSKNPSGKEIPIISDGTGYYAHLPAWFIYGPSSYAFSDSISKKYPKANFAYYNEKNKYYIGTAVCLTPFFVVGHMHAKIAGVDTDGYSWPYLFWVNMGTIFYAVLGLVGFFLLLKRFNLSYSSIYLSLVGLTFGTNFLFYSYIEIPYSHIYSFCAINWLLLLYFRWLSEGKNKTLVLVFFIFGLSIIIRPTNGLIILLIPFLDGSFNSFVNRVKVLFSNFKLMLLLLLVFSVPILLQYVNAYLQYGSIRFNGYNNEGFTNWRHPYIASALFGFRKGLFVYGPFLLLFIPGLVMLYRKQRNLFFGISLFFMVSIYIISSWWCWWYGGSLGYRPFIDFYGVLVIPIALLIHYSLPIFKIFITFFIGVSVSLYLMFQWQYQYKIIHYENMNFPMFSKVFLKTDIRYKFCFYNEWDTIQKPANLFKTAFFSDQNEQLNPNKIYQNENLLIFRSVLVQHTPTDESKIGLNVISDVYLKEEYSFPGVIAFFYKNSVLLKERSMHISPRIDRIRQWEKVQVAITPELSWSQVDSIVVIYLSGENQIALKNPYIQYYRLK